MTYVNSKKNRVSEFIFDINDMQLKIQRYVVCSDGKFELASCMSNQNNRHAAIYRKRISVDECKPYL